MTRKNDKRNNNPELPPFAQKLFGAIVGKGVDMIAKKMAEIAEQETPDIHAEGISNQDVTDINNGKASLTKCTIPTDGTAVELPIPDNLQVFISEDGKPMIRKKIEGDEEPTNAAEGNPITYDDICKELFLDKKIYRNYVRTVNSCVANEANYNDNDNCTSMAQAKRMVAYNKLMNIAKYLNGEWKPNFRDNSKKWSINKYICYGTQYTIELNEGNVYFKSADLADEAIRLMGKESLDNLFSTDW